MFVITKKKILFIAILVLSLSGLFLYKWLYFGSSKLKLDMEETFKSKPLTSSTQSLNRYSSNLRELKNVKADYDKANNTLSVQLSNDKNSVELKDISVNYLVPILPYKLNGGNLTDFDRFNLMLAEYARNGVNLSHQYSNDLYGSFSYENMDYDSNNEYLFDGGVIAPNPNLLPKRISLINNCLAPGLWELSAVDSVGEMFHAWFDFPKSTYYEMIRGANGIETSDLEIRWALSYKKNVDDIELNLTKLRNEVKVLQKGKARYNLEKEIAGYSSQDSRRKVQKGFFSVVGGDSSISPKYFSDLKDSHRIEMHSFIPPGVYTADKKTVTDFILDWEEYEIKAVEPKTSYLGQSDQFSDEGYIEITLYNESKDRALVLGNLPVDLLVYQEDYSIPAFGVGVYPSSELIERRLLRSNEGPKPYYAYLTNFKNNKHYAINNHEVGLEQLHVRPKIIDGKTILSITAVSYERIVDIFEVVIELNEEISRKIDIASQQYSRPAYRSYADTNLL